MPIIDHARDVLTLGGYSINETRALPTGLGCQLRCEGGVIVTVYNTGKIVPQGKDAAAVKALFAAAPMPKPAAVSRPPVAAATDKPTSRVTPQHPGSSGGEPGEEFVPRYPPGWSDEPWDGVTVPF
jgi:predicted nucleotide-binding protein